jgi:RNA polymerase sigma-70 factor, ECF subfamily
MWLLAAFARVQPAAESQAQDISCLGRIAAGDRAAAADLYDRHARPLFSLILRIVGNEPEAEDVLQEVFAQAFRQASRYDARRGVVAAWLLTIARSRAIERLRARRARIDTRAGDLATIDEVPDGQPDAVSTLLDEERARLVRQALGALPLLQRLAIELAYYEGLSHAEVAERLEQPLGTIKTRIRSGLLKLRDALTEGRA